MTTNEDKDTAFDWTKHEDVKFELRFPPEPSNIEVLLKWAICAVCVYVVGTLLSRGGF